MPFAGAMFTAQDKTAPGPDAKVTLFKTFFGGNVPLLCFNPADVAAGFNRPTSVLLLFFH